MAFKLRVLSLPMRFGVHMQKCLLICAHTHTHVPAHMLIKRNAWFFIFTYQQVVKRHAAVTGPPWVLHETQLLCVHFFRFISTPLAKRCQFPVVSILVCGCHYQSYSTYKFSYKWLSCSQAEPIFHPGAADRLLLKYMKDCVDLTSRFRVLIKHLLK